MKLISINGKIWELSTLESDKYADSPQDKTPLEQKNISAIQGCSWFNNIVRPLSSHQVKSKAHAIIEIIVSGLPQQHTYDIYHNSKGFYCIVQKQRVFLLDLLQSNNSESR